MDANEGMRVAAAMRATADRIEARIVDLKCVVEQLRAEADSIEAREALA
jgi:hypothetical protein